MNIQMTGIDHSAAGVSVRELFSFTNAQAERAMEMIIKQPGVHGCVLLSTCNRTELWVSAEPDTDMDLPGMIGSIKQIDMDENKDNGSDMAAGGYRQYFRSRRSQTAVEHLFYLTAGLKSRILGEDQILSQVKDAWKRARGVYCTDTLLEVLFRYAVTAGKEVRTAVPALHTDISAPHYAIAGLKQQGYDFAGKKCLVIGNGQMGRMTAQALQEEGALVTVTVRQYRSGVVEIPKGCSRIAYGERYMRMPESDLIVSATASPNLTVRRAELEEALAGCHRQQVYLDLAVPRDMEEEIAGLDNVTLYNIDAFQSNGAAKAWERQKKAAQEVLKEKLAEFKDWYECRELVPRLQQIGRKAAEDICWRMGRGLSDYSKEERGRLDAMLEESAAKAVDKLLFALRDGLPREELYHCVELLERIQYG